MEMASESLARGRCQGFGEPLGLETGCNRQPELGVSKGARPLEMEPR
jgi:hypothetical protein